MKQKKKQKKPFSWLGLDYRFLRPLLPNLSLATQRSISKPNLTAFPLPSCSISRHELDTHFMSFFDRKSLTSRMAAVAGVAQSAEQSDF